MPNKDIETVSNAIAQEVDQVGSDKAELFLAQLALLLANALDNNELALQCISDASVFQKTSDSPCTFHN